MVVKEKRIGKLSQEEFIFYIVYGLWFLVYNLSLTYWRKLFPYKTAQEYMDIVVYLLLIYQLFTVGKKSFNKWITTIGFLSISFIAGYISNTDHLFAMAALVGCASRIDYEKIFKEYILISLSVFVITVVASKIDFIENLTHAGDRTRFGLGYVYISYPAHIILFISLSYIAIRKKMHLIETVILIYANYFVYTYSVTRTSFVVAVLFIGIAVFVSTSHSKSHIKKKNTFIAYLLSSIPFLVCCFSYVIYYLYNDNNAKWKALDDALSGRMLLGHTGLMKYSLKLLGQVINWVPYSKVTATKEYFYIDNYYIQCGLVQGLIFLLIIIVGYSIIIYRNYIDRNYMIVIAVIGLIVYGFADYQVIDMKYHPFYLLIGKLLCDCGERNNETSSI